MSLELLNIRDGEVFDTKWERKGMRPLITSPVTVNLPYDIDYKDNKTVVEDVRRQVASSLPQLSRYRSAGFSLGIGHQLGSHVSQGVIYPVQFYVGRILFN